MRNLGKTESINLSVTPEFKALLKARAETNHRSITGYLEWLVLQEEEAARTPPKKRRG
ncbi:MAG: hypothetical protein IPN66_06195 [Candidatus Competibacteraceae bacterium]|jgi:uncharacterized protein (DUF1778 family)|nr:hypothetical protein [Candidatus Competibacteraceae bacterium]MBK8896787.1 hypothetical protein [Candidatus Competibacteraceae bacterium]MBK8896807.1 hypothetical protein [Candidatus Competibacteraceae bacterium]HPB12200.1 hypothetical protein [Kiritimatiellia bacterium]